MDTPTQVDLDSIRARAAAATPGPWFWRGNVDYSDPELSCYKPGWGRVEIMRHVARDRTPDDRQIRDIREVLQGASADIAIEEYLTDSYDVQRTDDRLAFVDQKTCHAVQARELAVYEVAPNATDRSDPKVYRADIVGVRHPDAEFIAHSRHDVDTLLAIVTKHSSEIAAVRSPHIENVLKPGTCVECRERPLPCPNLLALDQESSDAQ